MVWRFEPEEDLRDAFRRVALEQIARVRGGFSDPNKERARAVHEARQGFKRLRALLRLAAPSLGSSFTRENRVWRDAARKLAGSRDQTVLVESFDNLVGDAVPALPEGTAEVLRPYLVLNGRDADGPSMEANVEEVLEMLDLAEPRHAKLKWPGGLNALSKGLRLSQSHLKANWKTARADPSSHALHEWRKRVKDQSAQLRLFRNSAPVMLRERHEDAKRTAALLGDEHDLWMLAAHLSSQSMPPEAASARDALLGEIEARRHRLRDEALSLGRRFSGQSKKAFARELTAAWEKASPRAGSKTKKVKKAGKRATSPAL